MYFVDAFFMLTIVIIMMLALFLLCLQLVFNYFLFEKMGEPGYKGLIPIYSDYVLFDKVWKKENFWAFLLFSFVAGLFSSLATAQLGIIFSVLCWLIYFASIVTVFIYEVGLCIRLAKRFGQESIFGIGLFIFPFIFTGILALNNDMQFEDK